MSGPALSVLVFALVGGLASAWVLGVRLRRERRRIGLRALSAMHWREFQRLMIDALQRRGYERVPGSEAGEHEGLAELRHEGRTWLLSTKHGAGYVPGLAAINEFASALRLRGAAGGWMTTLGRLTPDAVAQARLHGITLLDGAGAWNAIEPVLEPAQRAAIFAEARRDALRGLAIAWTLAAAAALAVFPLHERAPDARTTTTARRAAPARQPSAAAAAPASAEAVAPDDPQALQRRRRSLADAVGTLPWVERALWATRSTLVVYLAGEGDADKAALCALVEPYPELRASRLQLQPPRGSGRPVRFIQCRSF